MFESMSTFALISCLIALLLVVIFITLIWLIVYSGVFQTLDDIGTGKPPIGQAVIAYRYLQGPYNESGQTFTEAAIISPGNKALGIYYDDPQKVRLCFLTITESAEIQFSQPPFLKCLPIFKTLRKMLKCCFP